MKKHVSQFIQISKSKLTTQTDRHTGGHTDKQTEDRQTEQLDSGFYNVEHMGIKRENSRGW